MFTGFFHYDNPVWRFIGKFWDVLVVNILWFICSIPIITIGPSFFKSFKENFKQATAIWVIFLLTGLLMTFDLYYFVRLASPSTFQTVMISVFLAMIFVWLAMFTYVFPLQARFYNQVKRTIFNAFFMSVCHGFHTIGMMAVDAGILFLSVTYLPQLSIFGVALIAFFNSYMLNSVFNKYIPEQEDKEMKPLSAEGEEEKQPENYLS